MTLKDNILKYNAQVPRYTSYPTAPHFKPTTGETYAGALQSVDPAEPVSLYIHVPFCKVMCWYCGCHTTATRKYAPVEEYLALLAREVKMVAECLPSRMRLSHLHFGGGSPTMLSPEDFRSLMDNLRVHFDFLPVAEIALEADPRGITHDRARVYSECGVNRMSFGVQDFSHEVQKAINRVQSFDVVEKSVTLCRDFGIERINFDLMYGLPLQTVVHVEDTVMKSLSLTPGRIALFGYAHVPWMKKHMRLIRDEDLPDAALRIDQFGAAERLLVANGMEPVGLDHFVRAEDDMHRAHHAKTLARNFQGYTTDGAGTMIGLGVSSIGRFPHGFFQNVANMTEYSAAILDKKLPTARGCAISAEDALRGEIISDLMCYLQADVFAILQKHGKESALFDGIIAGLADLEADGLVTVQKGVITVLPAARQVVRVVAARFDAYFTSAEKRHVQAA